MTDKLLCPFCGEELEIGGVDGILRGCPKCRNLGTKMLWQALIDTMKKLDIACCCVDKHDSEDDEKDTWVACPKDDPDFIWTSGDTKNEVIDNLIKYDYDVKKYIIKKIKL